jgi:hypothetical protein
MADKGPYGKASWNPKRKVMANPELCRAGSGTPGNAELNRGAGMTDGTPELCRPGSMPATMPEIDRGGFKGMPFIDRTSQNESMTSDDYDATTSFIPGHKTMAGMP